MSDFELYKSMNTKKVFVEVDNWKSDFADENALDVYNIDLNDGWYLLLGLGNPPSKLPEHYQIILDAEEISFYTTLSGKSKKFMDDFTSYFCDNNISGRKIYSLTDYLVDMIRRQHSSDIMIEKFLKVCDNNEVYMTGRLNQPPIRLNREFLAEKKRKEPMY